MQTRRNFLTAMVATAALGPLLSSRVGAAEVYPSKPIKVVLPFATGGGSDVVARVVAERMSAALGQPMIIENIAGAGGLLAAAAVGRAAPDGYTLFLANASTLTIAPHLLKERAAPLPEFTPVGTVSQFSLILVVRTDSPLKSLKELVAVAKANPGKLSFASPGQGTTPHLIAEILRRETGVDILHVPYKGGAPAMNDLLGGQVNLFFEAPSTVLPQIHAGKLRALAVTSKTRLASLPDVPTVSEQGLSALTLESWLAFVAPPGTPAAIVARLNAEALAALRTDDVISKLRARGFETRPGSPDELAALVRGESRMWAQLIKQRGISTE